MGPAEAVKVKPLATLDGYGLTRVVARGGMADIYRARRIDAPDAPWLALKLMRASTAGGDLRAKLFEREVRVAAQIQHPNVVRLVDTGQVEGRPYLVMDYVQGRDAESFLTAHPRLPVELVVALGAQAAAGLAAAHRAVDGAGQHLNVVHRDVSPGNLRIDWSGRVKLLDFGVARLRSVSEPETQTGVIRGKFAYMSPEQAEGVELDPRSDVFSLGVVLYELLVGRRAFRAAGPVETLERVKGERLQLPSQARSDCPKQLDGILARCLAKDPGLRFVDASELAHELRRWLERNQVDGVAFWQAYLEATAQDGRQQEQAQLVQETRRFRLAVEAGAFQPFRTMQVPVSGLQGQSLLRDRFASLGLDGPSYPEPGPPPPAASGSKPPVAAPERATASNLPPPVRALASVLPEAPVSRMAWLWALVAVALIGGAAALGGWLAAKGEPVRRLDPVPIQIGPPAPESNGEAGQAR